MENLDQKYNIKDEICIISNGSGASLGDIIEELQNLKNKGYDTVEINVVKEYGDWHELQWLFHRPETDEEQEHRLEMLLAFKHREESKLKDDYAKLYEKFEGRKPEKV